MATPKTLMTYIPIGCPDIDLLVAGTGLKADKIRVIFHQMYLSSLSQGVHINKTKKHAMNQIHKDGYVALHTDILMKLISSAYRKYVDFLLSYDIIQTRESASSKNAYVPGEYSIHYRFNPKLFIAEGTWRRFRKETITDYCTIKAVLKTRDEYSSSKSRNARSISLEPIHDTMFSMEKTVRFNLENAEHWLNTLSKDSNALKKSDVDLETIEFQIDRLHAINEGIFNSKVDQFGERLYSPLKSVKSELREFMYFEGFETATMWNFDICNSQIYFFSLLFFPQIVSAIIPEFLAINDVAKKYIDAEDVQAFIKYARKGSIYSKWQEYRGLNTRDVAKKEIIIFLFAQKHSRIAGVSDFKNLLPNVKAFLDEIKSLTETQLPFITKTYLDTKGIYKPDSYHCNVSCAVQRLESRIFTKVFGQNLLDADVKPFFTIHDSIYYPESYGEKVDEAFNKTFNDLDIPKPKIKKHCPLF